MVGSVAPDLVRRQYPRREFIRGVGLLMNGEYQIRTGVEIGEGGIAFTFEEVIPTGTFAVINFQVPEGSFISIIVEIRGSEKNPVTGLFQIGCSFQNLAFDYKREIRTFVSART